MSLYGGGIRGGEGYPPIYTPYRGRVVPLVIVLSPNKGRVSNRLDNKVK